MTIRFLGSRRGEISNCLREMFRKAEEIYCIVAFWGRGADKIFEDFSKKKKGKIKIVCNLSMGGTNPKTIKKLRNRGVDVKHKPDLHSKVYWTEKGVIVGSANASANGLALQGDEQDGWLESALFTDRTTILKKTRLYVQEIWCTSERITEQDLEEAQRKWQGRRRELANSGPLSKAANWEAFVKGLKERNEDCHASSKGWDVFSKENSYLHTISAGNRIF